MPEVEGTFEDLMRFLKADDLVQNKDRLSPILAMSLGADDKNAECNNMNNSVCFVQSKWYN